MEHKNQNFISQENTIKSVIEWLIATEKVAKDKEITLSFPSHITENCVVAFMQDGAEIATARILLTNRIMLNEKTLELSAVIGFSSVALTSAREIKLNFQETTQAEKVLQEVQDNID